MYLAPLAGYDLSRLPAQLCLRLAEPATDVFEPFGDRSQDMSLTPHVAVYACGSTVTCYAFNHRDSRLVGLTPSTEEALFFGEALTESQDDLLLGALGDLADRIRKAGAEVSEMETWRPTAR